MITIAHESNNKYSSINVSKKCPTCFNELKIKINRDMQTVTLYCEKCSYTTTHNGTMILPNKNTNK